MFFKDNVLVIGLFVLRVSRLIQTLSTLTQQNRRSFLIGIDLLRHTYTFTLHTHPNRFSSNWTVFDVQRLSCAFLHESNWWHFRPCDLFAIPLVSSSAWWAIKVRRELRAIAILEW